MNWLRRLFGLHVHEWSESVGSVEIPPCNYIGPFNTRIQHMGRTIYYRACLTCQELKHVCPE